MKTEFPPSSHHLLGPVILPASEVPLFVHSDIFMVSFFVPGTDVDSGDG